MENRLNPQLPRTRIITRRYVWAVGKNKRHAKNKPTEGVLKKEKRKRKNAKIMSIFSYILPSLDVKFLDFFELIIAIFLWISGEKERTSRRSGLDHREEWNRIDFTERNNSEVWILSLEKLWGEREDMRLSPSRIVWSYVLALFFVIFFFLCQSLGPVC